jgi:hypothetical protein
VLSVSPSRRSMAVMVMMAMVACGGHKNAVYQNQQR